MPIVAPVPASPAMETPTAASMASRGSQWWDLRLLPRRARERGRGRFLCAAKGLADLQRRLVRRGLRLVGGVYRSPSAPAPCTARPMIGNPNTPYPATTTHKATAPAVENAVTAGSGAAAPRRDSSSGLWMNIARSVPTHAATPRIDPS